MTKSEYYEVLDRMTKSDKDRRKAEDAWEARVAKVAAHSDTIVLTESSHPSAWAFVKTAYPSVADRVAATKILKNDNTAFCRRIGIPSDAGGLYVKPSSTILLLYARGCPDDIIVVHELLHLVSRMLGGEGSAVVEEDFAYGKSLPYVLSRMSREWVVEKYLMPYYSQAMMSKHRLDPSPQAFRKAKKLAEEHCNLMVDEALGKPKPDAATEDLDVFDFIS